MEYKYYKKNILIVEDDRDWADTIKEYLEDEKFKNIFIAHKLEDALLLLKNNTFSVAIIDLNLKDSLVDKLEEYDGLKLIKEIDKISYPYQPLVIVITAYKSERPDILKGKKYIPAFFPKNDFDKTKFLNVLKSNMPSKI